MFVVLHHIEQLRPNVWTFWVEPERRFRFSAGQYVELHIPHSKPDSRGEHRWLTISSTPYDELLGLTTKFPPQISTYKQALQRIKPGVQLHLSDPIGDFVLPKLTSVPVVLVAAGIGITPMQSMVADMVTRAESRPIQLLHLGKTVNDLLFTDTFLQSGITYRQIVLEPPTGWAGLAGRVSGERVLEITSTLRPNDGISAKNLASVTSSDSRHHNSRAALNDTLYYLSGPEKLVMKIHDELITCGISRQQIVLDYFPGYVDL